MGRRGGGRVLEMDGVASIQGGFSGDWRAAKKMCVGFSPLGEGVTGSLGDLVMGGSLSTSNKEHRRGEPQMVFHLDPDLSVFSQALNSSSVISGVCPHLPLPSPSVRLVVYLISNLGGRGFVGSCTMCLSPVRAGPKVIQGSVVVHVGETLRVLSPSTCWAHLGKLCPFGPVPSSSATMCSVLLVMSTQCTERGFWAW